MDREIAWDGRIIAVTREILAATHASMRRPTTKGEKRATMAIPLH